MAAIILWGDTEHNDRPAIRHLLCGGCAYDARRGQMIVAPTLAEIPPGNYWLVDDDWRRDR